MSASTTVPEEPEKEPSGANLPPGSFKDLSLHAYFQLDLDGIIDGDPNVDEQTAARALFHLEGCAMCQRYFDQLSQSRVLRARLVEGDLPGAQAALKGLLELDPVGGERWAWELVFLEDRDDQKQRVLRRRSLWLLLAECNARRGLDLLRSDLEPNPVDPVREVCVDTEETQGAEAKGKALELAVESLFRRLFEVAPTGSGIELEHVRRQGSGYQFGYDVQVRYRHDGRTVNLAVECKDLTTPLSPDKVVHKWVQLEDSGEDIDHWILISPAAVPTPVLWHLVDRSRCQRRYPFNIQIWCPQNGVEEFFRLIPAVHARYFPTSTQDQRPERSRCAVPRWLDRLRPWHRLPSAWLEYLLDPRKQRMRHESHLDLELAWGRRVRLRCSDADHQPLGSLDEYVRRWLEVPSSQVLFVFGGFGSGKTFSTYVLCRELALEYLSNPITGTVCLRLPLRSFSRCGSIDSLLRDSLDRIGVSLADWHVLCAVTRVLVVLDGFDEMSVRLDQQSIEQNIVELQSACQGLGDVKVLVTSRTRFFGSIKYELHLRERLVQPKFVYLEPLRRRESLGSLLRHARSPEERARINELAGMNDPIGLASRPLFHSMIQEILQDLPSGPIDQTSLYERYVHRTLERNEERLDPEGVGSSRRSVHENLLKLMERVALRLHESGRPFVHLADLAGEAEEQLARSLWKPGAEAGAALDVRAHTDSDEQDAIGRLGLRSLLVSIEGVEREEGWPVDFSSRSMREYFVARALVRALREDAGSAGRLLFGTSLSRETIEFAAELLRKDRSRNYVTTLVAMAQATRVAGYSGNSAGAAISLILRVGGELPGSDWSGARLDGADLTNADLKYKNLSGATLRDAILANADLVGTDLRRSDLHGVELKETGRVQALCVVDEESVLVGYDDGVLRQWDLAAGRDETRCTIEGLNQAASGLHASSDESILLRWRETVLLLDRAADGLCSLRSTFDLRSDFVALELRGGRALLAFDDRDATVLRHFDLDRAEILHECRAPLRAGIVHAVTLCEDEGVVAATSRGAVFYSFDGQALSLGGPSVHVVSAIRESDVRFLVAGGDQFGRVHVWELERAGGSWTAAKQASQQVHFGSVTAVVWTNPICLVTGGDDRFVWSLAYSPLEDRALPPYRSMIRKLRCEGALVAGLVPSEAREALVQFGARDAEPAGAD